MKIKFIGQSTFLFDFDGTVILTDPWFSLNIMRKNKLKTKINEIEKCDIMLVSHSHIDHIDNISLNFVKEKEAIFIGPASACKKANIAGVKEIKTLTFGEKIEVKNINIYSIRGYHTFSKDALCFIVEKDKKIFFSGDTRYNEKLTDDLRKHNIDIAIVQICCAYYPLKDGMNLDDAVKLLKDIKPKIAIPMHYDMYLKSIPPEKLKYKLKDDDIRVDIFKQGEEKEYA